MLIKDWNTFFQVESNVLEVLRRPNESECPTDQIHVDVKGRAKIRQRSSEIMSKIEQKYVKNGPRRPHST